MSFYSNFRRRKKPTSLPNFWETSPPDPLFTTSIWKITFSLVLTTIFREKVSIEKITSIHENLIFLKIYFDPLPFYTVYTMVFCEFGIQWRTEKWRQWMKLSYYIIDIQNFEEIVIQNSFDCYILQKSIGFFLQSTVICLYQ